MPTYPVLIDDWQFECCGEPFAVGDRVSWTLELLDGAGWPGELRAVVAWQATDRAEGVPVLRSGALAAARLDAVDPACAVLHEEHHGRVPGDMPSTEGVVEGLAVCVRRYRVEGRRWTAIPGALTLREVERTPEGFARGPEGDATPWCESGLVAFLRVE